MGLALPLPLMVHDGISILSLLSQITDQHYLIQLSNLDQKLTT